jgi:hypothetical protein
MAWWMALALLERGEGEQVMQLTEMSAWWNGTLDGPLPKAINQIVLFVHLEM